MFQGKLLLYFRGLHLRLLKDYVHQQKLFLRRTALTYVQEDYNFHHKSFSVQQYDRLPVQVLQLYM